MLLVRRRAPASSDPGLTLHDHHTTSKGDSELSLILKLGKYEVVNGSESMNGTSIVSSYDLVNASLRPGERKLVLSVRRRAPASSDPD